MSLQLEKEREGGMETEKLSSRLARSRREVNENLRGAAAALTHRTMMDLPLFWHQNRGRVIGEKHLHMCINKSVSLLDRDT